MGLEKNLDLLVSAFAKVKTPDARLLIIGDGPYRPELDERIEQLGITDRVTFTGYLQRPDVATALGTSDLLFFASTSETQGLVVGEAMASGLPVVAVQDLAVGDAVVDGVNGFLVPERAAFLAEAADKVLSDPALAAAMGAESLKRAESLGIDLMAARLSDFYDDLCAVSPSERSRGLAAPVIRRVERQMTRLRRRGRVIVRRYL